MSEDRSKGMYHPVIGKPSLRVGLFMGLLIGLSLLLLAACGDQNSAKGGAGQEHKKNASGDSDATNGQIVFRRYLDPDQTKASIFTMNPDGSHVSQITPLPTAGATRPRCGLLMGRRSPSIAGVSPRIATGAGSWSSTSTRAIRARSHTAYPMGGGLRSIRLHHPVIIAWETPNPPSQPTVSQ